MDNEDTDFTAPTDGGADRPIGFWLRAVDRLISREFAEAFAAEEIDRRDWMLLNALSGDVQLPPFADRFVRKGKRLRRLEERGWAEEQGDGSWTLTDEGRQVRARLAETVDGIRSRVAGAVPPEDYATTIASLEAMARELGWDEWQRMPRGGFGPGRRFGRGPGFGPGIGHGFGPGFGHGFGPGFGPSARHGRGDHECHEAAHGGHHAHHGHHGHHGGRRRGGEGRSAERAFERGFEAGFARGRSGDTA
jgi:hypothetical protein